MSNLVVGGSGSQLIKLEILFCFNHNMENLEVFRRVDLEINEGGC